MRGKYYKIQLQNSKYKHYFQHQENVTNFRYGIQNPKHYFQLKEITPNSSYQNSKP